MQRAGVAHSRAAMVEWQGLQWWHWGGNGWSNCVGGVRVVTVVVGAGGGGDAAVVVLIMEWRCWCG